MIDDDVIKALRAKAAAEAAATGRSDTIRDSFLRRLEGRPLSPEEQEKQDEWEAEQRQQALREIEERQRAEQEAVDAARPSILERVTEAIGTTIAGALAIALALALALGGLYVLVRLVKWAWTG